jgi:MFS transporter, DHA3 family, tetracycline resistance protein
MTGPTPPQVTDEQAPPAVRDFLAPLRRGDFRWLVAGQMLSTFGNMMFVVALPFIVLRHDGAGELSVLLTVLGLARIVGAPIGGVLSDRWQPRRVMLSADVARAIVLLVLVQVGVSDGAGILPLTIAIFFLGVLDGIFVPAYWAMTPHVLPEKELTVGNAVGESLMIVAVMVGPLVGGFAMASMPPATVVAANALTFLVSAATLLRVKGLRTGSVDPHEGGARDTSAFRSFLKRSRLLVAMLVMTGVLHLTSAGIVSVALPVFAHEEFPDGPRVFGLLLSAQGAGLLVGTLAAGLSLRASGRGYLAVTLLVFHGAALAVFPYLSGLVPLMLTMAVLGLVAGVLTVLVLTLLQQISPPGIRGRVMAAFTSVTIGSYPVSVVLIGLIVTGWGVGTAFLIGGIGALSVAVIGITQRTVREA